MNIENALKIEGWMQPAELQWLASQAAFHDKIAEVGSWMGRSTRALADNTAGTVFAIDTWAGSNEPNHVKLLADKDPNWLIERFMANVGNLYNVEVYRRTSLEAAKAFQDLGIKFDMIFLDAAHDYDNVLADIKAWLPLLEDGGLICGHDFLGPFAGVTKAVTESFPNNWRKVGAGSIWSTR